jgi:hypothetical protein
MASGSEPTKSRTNTQAVASSNRPSDSSPAVALAAALLLAWPSVLLCSSQTCWQLRTVHAQGAEEIHATY